MPWLPSCDIRKLTRMRWGRGREIESTERQAVVGHGDPARRQDRRVPNLEDLPSRGPADLLTKDDLDDACLDGMPDKPCYAWRLGDLRYVEPFPVKGRLNIFDVPDELIHVIWDGDDVDVLERVYKSLVYFGRDDSAREVWDFSSLR